MLTVFCLIVWGQFPLDVGFPLWALILSLACDLTLMALSKRQNHT